MSFARPPLPVDRPLRIRPDHRLAPVVAEAYEVFDLPRPHTLGVCRGCSLHAETGIDSLGHDARDLPAACLVNWYTAQTTEDLSFDTMGWLLPRILELLALGAGAFVPSAEMALARLPGAGFPDDWPPSAYDVVRRFCDQWLIYRVQRPTLLLDETLCTISNGGLPVGEFLGTLWELDTPTLVAVLDRSWVRPPASRIRQTAFWESQDARSLAWSWYVSPDLEDRLIESGLQGDERAVRLADLIRTTLRAPAT